MKTIAETLGVARSNLIERRGDAKPKRGPQDRPGDFELKRRYPTSGRSVPNLWLPEDRRALKRERRSDGLAPINTKRVYG